MSIDWITVAAQIANFLVLVWLLKRFLYQPILDGIDAREVQIADRMKEAGEAKAAANAAQTDYQKKLRTLELDRAALSESIRKQAEEQRDAMVDQARKTIAQDAALREAQQTEDARKYTISLQQAGGAALLSLCRKALDDLADETLETRMAGRLLAHITPMLPELKQAAGEAMNAVVLSRDPLPTDAKKLVSSQLGSAFDGINITFDTDPAQSPGLVLRIGGAQVGWTVDTYIEGLQQAMNAQLDKGAER